MAVAAIQAILCTKSYQGQHRGSVYVTLHTMVKAVNSRCALSPRVESCSVMVMAPVAQRQDTAHAQRDILALTVRSGRVLSGTIVYATTRESALRQTTCLTPQTTN